MANAIYILCALTAILCTVLLVRGYRQSRARLLFWSALCFAGLALNNILLVVDERMLTDVDLHFWRAVPAVIGVMVLVFGLVWETAR
jgi:archaellum biogenesis protein FlaJ (TadC family)